jgi:hypothetical protein
MRTLQLIFSIAICSISFSQVPNYVPTNGLVGWWPFNGNANDESGNGNNGTVNGAILTSDRLGNANKAYSFLNSDILITNQFYNNGLVDYTISLWFLTNNNSQSMQNIFNTTPHDGEGFGYNHANQPNLFSHWKNEDPNIHSWNIFSANPLNFNSIVTNTWYNLAIVKSGNIYSYFVNGLFDMSSMATISALNQFTGMRFGSIGGVEFLNGKLDDIGIWNRALTQQEITNLYTSTVPPTASVLNGDATICTGSSINLSVAVTGGTAPYTVTVTDGTNNYTATGASPVSIPVSPTAISTYSILSVTGGGTGTGNTGTATVTVIPNSTNTTIAAACESYVWNGQTYTQSGVYTGATTNCVTESLNLTITPSSSNTTTASACNSYTWNGTTYTASGVYAGATANCVTESLNLTITPSSTNTTTASACNSYIWNGTTYTQSGVYSGPTANCVTESLNLTINPSTSGTISQTALDSYTWPINNQTYTQSGIYTDTIPNAVGCDSIITLNLSMSYTGINELNTTTLSISPNPTSGEFTIAGLELFNNIRSMTILDVNGKVVKELDPKATKFSIGAVKPGVYFLNITAGNKQEVIKIIIEN